MRARRAREHERGFAGAHNAVASGPRQSRAWPIQLATSRRDRPGSIQLGPGADGSNVADPIVRCWAGVRTNAIVRVTHAVRVHDVRASSWGSPTLSIPDSRGVAGSAMLAV